jgi:hypothetical protein
MLLFILGLVVGWFLGFLLTAIISAGRRDDMISEEMYKKLDWT